MRFIAVITLASALAGCAAPSTNMRIGNEQSYISLQTQRDAVKAVAISETLPPGARDIGPVDASRCHRVQGDIEPTNEILIADIQAAAYGRGADGIYGLKIVKESGLTRNC